MHLPFFIKKMILFFLFSFLCKAATSQFLMDMIDTTKETGQGLLTVFKNYNHLKISGYMQPQFQYAESKGAKNYIGGDFQPNSDNRFMLRRGRIKFDYFHFGEDTKPTVQFVFQFDATERGVFARDIWGRILENKFKNFGLTVGMFARPFGYELNLSSSDRESPERGRMSQILMKTERDLGAMISFEPRNKASFLKYIKWDAGIFNGQGLTAFSDYDSYKDFISRLSLKSFPLNDKLYFSAGLSLLNGGFIQNNPYLYSLQNINNQKMYVVDSSAQNIGKELPRKYYGADAQLKFIHTKTSSTELRGEYWAGTQTANALTSETPAVLLTDPYYTRKFTGAFFYLLHAFSTHHQVGIKYDWYDPNKDLTGKEINAQTGATPADIKYSTFGAGYIYYVNENLKVVAWYDIITNEITALPGYAENLKDNIFTLRLQFRF